MLPQNSQHFALIEACITDDKNTLINVRKGSAGIGLNAEDLGMITAHSLFRSASYEAVLSTQVESLEKS